MRIFKRIAFYMALVFSFIDSSHALRCEDTINGKIELRLSYEDVAVHGDTAYKVWGGIYISGNFLHPAYGESANNYNRRHSIYSFKGVDYEFEHNRITGYGVLQAIEDTELLKAGRKVLFLCYKN